jgi:hypothetical protein
MGRSDSRPEPSLRLCIPSERWPLASGSLRRVSQVPRLICLRTPSPTTPVGPAGAFAHYFPADARPCLVRETGHPHFALTRPKWVHLRYGLRIRLSRLRQWDYSHPRSIGYLLNEQFTRQAPFSLLDRARLFLAHRTSALPATRFRMSRIGLG